MKVIKRKVIESDYDGADVYVTIKMSNMENLNAVEVIKKHFYTPPCGHMYDCCDCISTTVWTHKIKKIGRNLYTAELYVYRNL